jgi:hypothetical protein
VLNAFVLIRVFMSIAALNARFSGLKISTKLSYLLVRRYGKMEGQGGGGDKTPSVLSLPLSPPSFAGWPSTCVLVTVKEAEDILRQVCYIRTALCV